MHIINVALDFFSNLFRSHRYFPVEKLYSAILFIAGLSLRDLSERLCLTCASRESVRIRVHRFSSLFRPSRRVRRLVAVDETVLKVKGQICYPQEGIGFL
jgi:transposase-like protein